MEAVRLALEATPPGWRVTVTTGNQKEIIDVPAADFRGRRLPCRPGEAVADVARSLSPTTPPQALAAGRLLAERFLPPGWAVANVTIEADPDDAALHLPWNLLADAQGHLLARGLVVREIRGEGLPQAPLQLPLRVLFVVAAGLDDRNIAAGAEYLGLLRRLDTAGLPIEHTVRVTPTLVQLEATIAQFRPQVVHWIGHGSAQGLDLPADAGTPVVTAGHLAQVCKNIPVLVLNACHTAGAENPSVPFAAALIRSGMPVVVGLQGRARDRACRLFTWHLYRALAAGEPLAAAVALGQRAGLAEADLEWSRPALFLRAHSALTVDAARLAEARRADEIRRVFQPRRAYFCGHFEALGEALNLKGPAGGMHTALLLRLNPRDLEDRERDKVGLTWLLDELGGRLTAAGRVPVELLFPDERAEVPVDFRTLAEALSRAVRRTRKDLGLAGKGEALRAFADQTKTTDPLDLLDEFVEALTLDLVALATESGRGPVLVLDDLHKLGSLAPLLLTEGLGRFGLGTEAVPVPLVAAFVESEKLEYAGAVGALRTFAETSAPQAVRVLSLRPFTGNEERLAYQQYLVGQPAPLIAAADTHQAFDLFHAFIRGVPSLFPAMGPGVVEVLTKWGLIQVADDEALLKVRP